MIEISVDSLLDTFFMQAERFLSEPTVINGMEFDDATVKLKRLLLSSQPDHAAIGILNGFAVLIRDKDVAGLGDGLSELRRLLG